MAYRYEAYTAEGNKVRGRIEAPSEQRAEEILWQQEYTVVSIKRARAERGHVIALGGGIKLGNLVVFSRQLATLIESGISIVRALRLLREQVPNRQLRQLLADIVTDLEQGSFLSEAILRKEKAFPPFYGRLIEVGERTGNLGPVLRQLALYMEKEQALVRQIRGAMMYPSFVLLMAIGVVFIMLTVALPHLTAMFLDFDMPLPWPTRALIALTSFLSGAKFYILGGVAFLSVVGVRLFKTRAGRLLIDGTLLKVPVIGPTIIKGAVSRMCVAMSTLLRAGVPMPEIMSLVTRAQGNRVVAAALERVRDELLEGRGLSAPLAHQEIFPALLVQMVRVARRRGLWTTVWRRWPSFTRRRWTGPCPLWPAPSSRPLRSSLG